MCGIIGILGNRLAAPIVIKGLERLEYRGYDSSGIATIKSDGSMSKTKGKVSDLEKITEEEPSRKEGNIGIGHTRWATHGVPNDINSHPHFSQSGDLIIVHNGIIENYDTLKKELASRGYVFQSDTDTEVLVNLIEEVKNQEGCKLGKAVQLALTQVIGAYAIAVLKPVEPPFLAYILPGFLLLQ
jgi:glucosamine--fructose-6-phosphate aminotransferase (isomerizing)